MSRNLLKRNLKRELFLKSRIDVPKQFSFHNGVLLLRLEDAVAEEKLSVIQNIFLNNYPAIKNNFSVYQNGKLRYELIYHDRKRSYL